MKKVEKEKSIQLRLEGYSLNDIANMLSVSKGSVSLWVRDVELTKTQTKNLSGKSFTRAAVEKRRASRLASERLKREAIISDAECEIPKILKQELWLIGIMLYWAEGGKTQRMVRFSNGDPEMIKIMMAFFRRVCETPEQKFRGYIHIHPQLNYIAAEKYWSEISDIPLGQFFKTYRKPNKSSQSKKNSLPYGTFDIYVMDTQLFYKIHGWARGVFNSY